jgi:general L-amino acid transport system permease protein
VGVIILVRWAHRRQERSGKQFHSVYASLGLLIGLPLIVAALAGFPLSWDLPVLKGFNFVGGVQLVPEFVALVFALSLYTAAFIAEVVRSGIMAVSKGQTEAALSVGLTTGQTLRLIVLPQALRVIIPPLTNQYLNLTKNSSLAAAIAYPDLVLVFAGTALMQTGQAVEIIAITMAVYLTLSLVISLTMGFFNRRFAIVDR